MRGMDLYLGSTNQMNIIIEKSTIQESHLDEIIGINQILPN